MAVKTRRALKLEGTDTVLEIHDAIRIPHHIPFMYLFERQDGTWKLEYSAAFVDRFSMVNEMAVKGLEHGSIKGRPIEETRLTIANHDLITGHTNTLNEFIIERLAKVPQNSGLRRLQIEASKNGISIVFSDSLIPVLHEFKGFTVIREGDE